MNSTDSSTPRVKSSDRHNASHPTAQGQIPPFTDVSTDPEYQKLAEYYQKAEFNKCNELLAILLKRYPEDPKLLEFEKDLEMQLSLRNINQIYSIKEKEQKKKTTIRMSALTIAAIVFVVLVFIGSFWILSREIISQRQRNNAIQLASLEGQAVELLNSGQPQIAAGLIEKMRAIDPSYGSLPDLSDRANLLMQLESTYQTARGLMDQGDYKGALMLFNEIDTTQPGLWDVSQQKSKSETMIQVAALMQAGNDAYQAGKWSEVIMAYESALELDHQLNDPIMKEQLLNGYLRRIIEMLENDSTSVEDIEKAEQYYRKATAMIPQSKAFASERENLQKVSSSLLQLKFTQTARALLEENNQSITSISKAVSYLNKAVNLDPNNAQLKTDLRNASLYQIAFRYYLDMNWGLAISNLNQLMAVNQNYANGNAKLLLYEAYYSLGAQYYSVGVYQDARSNLEQAEILAYDQTNNRLKLFQVQMMLGDTIAKMGDYANAVSYYQYALNTVGAYNRASADTNLSTQLVEAEILAAAGNMQEAANYYYQIHQGISNIYTITEVEAPDGVCLAFFAYENHSTSDAIIEVNNLPKSAIITFGREIKVPTLD